MQPLKPLPLRPDKGLKQSKSDADVSALPRTPSFLSFTSLDQFKSSALFGIFEQGGYETEPPTPDPNVQIKPRPVDPVPRPNASLKIAAVAISSFLFISLFERIPSTNKFSIRDVQGTNPFLYAAFASVTAFVFPILDSHITTRQRKKRDWQASMLVRYFAGLLGLSYAATKLDFTQAAQFNICTAMVAIAVLLILDRSIRGFVVSILLTAFMSAGYLLVKETDDIIGISVLIWLNVCVWGSLGKVFSR